MFVGCFVQNVEADYEYKFRKLVWIYLFDIWNIHAKYLVFLWWITFNDVFPRLSND